jgi:hypothetical protein
MDLYEANTEAFVVRVWLEQTGSKLGDIEWRGHVTHAADGERRYVRELDGITDFIAQYLERTGARRLRRHRMRLWLHH